MVMIMMMMMTIVKMKINTIYSNLLFDHYSQCTDERWVRLLKRITWVGRYYYRIIIRYTMIVLLLLHQDVMFSDSMPFHYKRERRKARCQLIIMWRDWLIIIIMRNFDRVLLLKAIHLLPLLYPTNQYMLDPRCLLFLRIVTLWRRQGWWYISSAVSVVCLFFCPSFFASAPHSYMYEH